MDLTLLADSRTVVPRSSVILAAHFKNFPCILANYSRPVFRNSVVAYTSASTGRPRKKLPEFRRQAAVPASDTAGTTNCEPYETGSGLDEEMWLFTLIELMAEAPDEIHHAYTSWSLKNRWSTLMYRPREGMYTVGDFMTRKEDLHVVKPSTTVDEALEMLVEKRITGFPVIDDDWNLVGVVSDYDLLALDSISGGGSQQDMNMFPDVDSTWKTFNEIQKLLSKTNGQVVGDLMTPAPLVVHENSNLEDAARLLLKTKYRRLPVVNGDGKLVGIITRGNVVRAALRMKRAGGTL